ncbi:hypothetical protein D9615_002673 [Tricholomella constricta]|uniref:DNA topoisomerase (ATP-hydrolyzing) n=1 Tax=Tricholomella constricta TaxID=117010 RepID=A0A8H5HMW4_9AGAR|nr:hypothetical protein D9615_002673 [Tricholomella constricta]
MDNSQQSAEHMNIDEDDEMDEVGLDWDFESEEDNGPFNPRLREAVGEIEDMVISFLSQLSALGRSNRASDSESEDIESSRTHRTKSKLKLQLVDRTKGGFGSTAFKCMKYPKKSVKGSIRPMAQLFRVLDLTHEALVENVPATKRDIFYKDVPLFKSQRTVDSLIDDLAATFELERSDLNIRATAKGLVCGSGLVVHLHTGETVQVNDTEGTLIPVGEDIKSFGIDSDAVFQTLCRLRLALHPSLPGRGLIITGKGYPDIATRHLVKTLADALPSQIPILMMVDGDPYGIDILSVYKYGSRSLQHENTKLAAERVVWLGLCASELESFGVLRDSLLPITKHDEAKALSMLRRPAAVMPNKWRKELMHMLHSRRKAEIEVLSTAIVDPKLDGFRQSRFDAQNDNFDANLVVGHTNSITACSTSSDTSSTATPFSSPKGASSSYSSPFTSPPSSPPFLPSLSLAPSHAPLMRYLLYKITESVSAARARAKHDDYFT